MNRFQRRQSGATAFENLKRVSYKKPLMQSGERCHWLEADRTTHKYDPRWGNGVCLGRHSASDAHLIGTLGGVIQATTVRRLTREQRNDDVSKRAFDNLLVCPEIFHVQNHLWKWTLTPGCKGCIWARRGYHHTKACVARKRGFLLTKTRAEELRAAEAEAWKKPASSTELESAAESPSSARASGSAREEGVQPEPVDEQPQPNVGDVDMAAGTEAPDAEATRRTRIMTKRPDTVVPKEGVLKKL